MKEQDLKELQALADAIEQGSKEPVQGAAIQVTDELPRALKYLTPETVEALNRKAVNLIEIDRVGGVVKTWTCVYFGCRVPNENLELGVKKLAEILNGVQAMGHLHKALAPMISLELVQGYGEVPTTAVCSYVLVPTETVEHYNKVEFSIREGGYPNALTDIRAPLEPGEFIVKMRYSHTYQNLVGGEGVDKQLADGIAYRLSRLPKGSRHVSTRKLPIMSLATEYEVKFFNPELVGKEAL